jgi:nidogen-like
MPHRRRSLLLLTALLSAEPLAAATAPPGPDSWCGTGRTTTAVHVAAHRDHERRLERERETAKAIRTQPEAFAAGDVAVIVDDGSILVQPNLLDLEGLGVQYAPQKKGGYVASPSGDGVTDERGERLDLTDDDARQVAFPKQFKFRFYGKLQKSMFVHSDGNLTFGAADAASSERSVFRLLSGPPRIGAVFSDLNPEDVTEEGGGVFVQVGKKRVVVTWVEVPQFGNQNRRNTFQIVLYPNGRITFAFAKLQSEEAVVGIAPGGGGTLEQVDYTADLPTGIVKGAIAERFTPQQTFDELAVAQAFLREFADDYDHLIVFLDFQQGLGGAFAFEFLIKNEVRGLGLPVFDFTAEVGSRGRLRSFVQMGTLSRYPADPNTDFLGTNNTLDVLGQESGHRWLAFLHFIDGDGQRSNDLLGRDDSHWSFCHNTLASDMEGNQIRDEGGDRFTTVEATERFSPLDQYAMGLIPASEVPPFFYVDNCFDPGDPPEVGVTIRGPRREVAIDQVIAAEGQRVPAADHAPHDFRMAFILVTAAGADPSPGSIEKVDRIRAAWEPYFAQAVDGRGSVSTALVPR